MTITNPYTGIPKEVFKRTFLQEVSASITFAEVNLLGKSKSIEQFLKANFDINNVFPEELTFGGVEVTADKRPEKFTFSTNVASVVLGSDAYVNYVDSFAQRIQILVNYLQAIGVAGDVDLTITKRNLFQGNSENAFSAWRVALFDSFQDDTLRDIACNTSFGDKSVRISVEGETEFEGGDVKVPFLINVPDNTTFQFQMDIIGNVKAMTLDEVSDNAKILNEIIYCAFYSMLSDKIINLMKE